MAEELVGRYGQTIAELTLVPSKGGIFVVEVDGRPVFNKKETGRFPEDGEVAGLVEQVRS